MQPRTTHAILVGLLVGRATPTDSSLRARVTEFGMYRRGTEIVRADAAAPSGQSRGTLGFRLLKSTESIPPVIGTSLVSATKSPAYSRKANPISWLRFSTPRSSDQMARSILTTKAVPMFQSQ